MLHTLYSSLVDLYTSGSIEMKIRCTETELTKVYYRKNTIVEKEIAHESMQIAMNERTFIE